MIVSDICGLIRDKARISIDERSDADLLKVVNAAYRDVCGIRLWKWRQAITQVITIASYTTGTAAVTLGSADVPITTGVPTAAMVGRKFRANSNLYDIASIDVTAPNNKIVLTWVFNEASNATSAYVIFPDGYSLPANFGVQDFVKQEGYQPLTYKTKKFMEELLSSRIVFGQPEYYSIWGGKIYFYPIPSSIIQYEFHYWKSITALALADTPLIPDNYQNVLLELGVAWERERNDQDPQKNLDKAQGLIDAMIAEDDEKRDEVEHLGSSSMGSGITVKTTSRVPETFGHEPE